MNLGKKQRRNEVICDEVDLEKKKDIWKAFCVSSFIIFLIIVSQILGLMSENLEQM